LRLKGKGVEKLNPIGKTRFVNLRTCGHIDRKCYVEKE